MPTNTAQNNNTDINSVSQNPPQTSAPVQDPSTQQKPKPTAKDYINSLSDQTENTPQELNAEDNPFLSLFKESLEDRDVVADSFASKMLANADKKTPPPPKEKENPQSKNFPKDAVDDSTSKPVSKTNQAYTPFSPGKPLGLANEVFEDVTKPNTLPEKNQQTVEIQKSLEVEKNNEVEKPTQNIQQDIEENGREKTTKNDTSPGSQVTNVEDKTDELTQIHTIADTKDPITKFADEEENEFIKKVEEVHGHK